MCAHVAGRSGFSQAGIAYTLETHRKRRTDAPLGKPRKTGGTSGFEGIMCDNRAEAGRAAAAGAAAYAHAHPQR